MTDASTTAGAGFEVGEPILNGPFDEPALHWRLIEGAPPEKMPGRREAGYWYRDPKKGVQDMSGSRGVWRPMPLPNLIRERLAEWRRAGHPGLTRVSAELLAWWNRDGRSPRLFFAQREAAETIIFLTEARADFLQGIAVPRDDPGDDRRALGHAGFPRRCAKMATGAGKSTVAAMLAAWSILNKVADRTDTRFSDLVLIVCPNVTIRSRLGELDPASGEASIYHTRDLVPPSLRPDLAKGRVLITNWHAFEPQDPNAGARVGRRGVPETRNEWVTIGAKTTTGRGGRYYTEADYLMAVANGQVQELRGDKDGDTRLRLVRRTRLIESDAALVARILGRGGRNILVINDEAHHAYRIPPRDEEDDDQDALDPDDQEEDEADRKEATIWVEGLDRVHRLRGINLCVDLSATPYFLGRMGDATNTVFPWVVSDFGLTDAIESGLVKVPQLVARDTSGQDVAGYFNIWRWILSQQLTTKERGTARTGPTPDAVVKYANTPIAILAGMWAELLAEWRRGDDARPPVLILVAKNKRLAKTLFEWIGEDLRPVGIPSLNVDALRNRDGQVVTIRVDTSVVHDTDSGHGKSDENLWMRLTLDTVGRPAWPLDAQSRPIHPDGFAALAAKLGRPLHPPGRDVRCIVSVGMLTEGWDCNTVTHVIGLRPFQSQLLCEQVVGRALRRRSYDLRADGKLDEEVAKVFGVPFEVVPFKASAAGAVAPRPPQRRIFAVPQKAAYAISIPRVLGYGIGIRNRVTVPDWDKVAGITLVPMVIPPEMQLAASLNVNRPSVYAPGGVHDAGLADWRAQHRVQQLAFQMAAQLTRSYAAQRECEAPAQRLFPQVLAIVRRYLAQKVTAPPPSMIIDAFLAPYYGWIIERLCAAIRPDMDAGEAPEVPDIDHDRPCATSDISVFTGKQVRDVLRSHVNMIVGDSTYENSAGYHLDRHRAVHSFVKNHGLNFAIPYLHNGEPKEYLPDFVARLAGGSERYLICETKGADWDATAAVKAQAAHRWCAAINATGEYGHWDYHLAYSVAALVQHLDTLPTTQAAA